MIGQIFRKKNNPDLLVQLFTYYIPGPPTRNTSYREREFDRIMKQISSIGFQIKSIQTQAHSSAEQSGMWIICQLIPLTTEAINFDLNSIETLSESQEISLDQEFTIVHE